MPDRSNSPKASFVRGIFAGAIHDSLLFPYPPPLDERDADEARVVRRLVREIGRLRRDLIDTARIDAEERIPEEIVEAFAEIGLLGISIPKEYGGLGLSAAGYARVFAAVSAADPSCGVLIGVHCGLGSKAIALYGNDEQKARYLPMLARGETLAAYALTEPETGSDAQHIVTRATPAPDGQGWLLNGRKHWIGNGHRAGVIATFAQTEVVRRGEKTQRPTAFIIRPDMPGFKVVGTVKKMGIRGSTQAELLYTDLRVPADHVLGEVGKGFAVAVNVLNAGRLSLASGCTAGAKQVLGQMAEYAEQRIQFGAPLASFEITQRKMAQIAADTYASDAMVGHLAWLAERDEEHALEAACAKVFASELLWRAADEMVQVAGGRGYVQPWPYERVLRDVRINRIFEGANEVLRLFVGLNGLQGPAEELKEIGAALRRPIENFNVVAGYATARVKAALGATDKVDAALDERLAKHKEYFEKHVAQLKDATQRAVLKYRKQIVERQLVVERLANMAIEMYATGATIARTQRLIDERGVDRCERELALCDLFCVESGRRFRDARNALDASEEDVDDTRRSIAAAVREQVGYLADDTIMDEPGEAEEAEEPLPAGSETAGARGLGGN
ncbi:MAG TPA: acyl-CoA dehydrogenase family protein [Gemmatimonadaceae bacterium]|nr:acyl-CoA dehydrogenase family protein [Gemmatimonadaceae bacterium]